MPRRSSVKGSPDGLTQSKRPRTSAVSDVSSLYQECVINRDWEKIQQCVDEGVLATTVWPYLNDHPTDEQACFLLSLLVTEEGGGDTSFMGQETMEKVLESSFWWKELASFNPVVVHFFVVMLDSPSRDCFLPLVSGVALLHFLPERRKELELRKSTGLRRTLSSESPHKPNRLWCVDWIESILSLIEDKSPHLGMLGTKDDDNQTKVPKSVWTYLFRSFELLIDLLSTVSTRQYLVTYLDSIHFAVRCQRATRGKKTCNRLLQQLLVRVYKLLAFPLKNGQAMSKPDLVSVYHLRATVVQKMCHRHYPDDVPDIIFAGVGILCTGGTNLRRASGGLSDEKLLDLLHRLRLVDKNEAGDKMDRDWMLDILLHHVTIPTFPLDELKAFPLYPTEAVLWDHNIIPPGTILRKTPVLSLPKLQTQFLSYLDYLLRNFELVRLESAYEIRSDLVDVIRRVRPVVRQAMVTAMEDQDEMVLRTEFTGWARMALDLEEPVRIMRVAQPRLGEQIPSEVVAEVTIDLVHCGDSIRREWEELREFDNLFLVTIDAGKMTGGAAPLLSELLERYGVEGRAGPEGERHVSDDEDSSFPDRYGVVSVRGGMVMHVRDDDGNILTGPSNTTGGQQGSTKRIFRVALDAAQYAKDLDSKKGADIYKSFNLVVRREGRENNFRAVLETIRGLTEGSGSIKRVIPPWLQPLLLGYGDPSSASYQSKEIISYAKNTKGVPKADAPLDFCDTFLDEKHIVESFPGHQVQIASANEPKGTSNKGRRNYQVKFQGDKSSEEVSVSSYQVSGGAKGNPIRFTPVQVKAIRSGLSLGLTMVVGPPGTGKTDVAVQIIASLYHSFPTQRTVVITHSNAALNDIFQKVVARGDIEERYLLRLGSGERELQIDSQHDFTQTGRVAHSLVRRGELLERVQQLSESMGVSGRAERGADGSPSYTCETAKYFQQHYVTRAVKKFERETKDSGGAVGDVFPFAKFLGLSEDEIMELSLTRARELLAEVAAIFEELAEYRPLELLRTQRQRTDYFLMKQTKIVAMTCTHAAIARSRLVELGFQYDNLVVEEAAQMMEIEAFIPLLLQRGEADEGRSMSASRLKRVCLIGDHHQLPPVIKNMSFAKYSNLDQSMFARLIRLGVPYIQLDRQGRARPEIAALYSWRYKGLGNLDHVSSSEKFTTANPGLAYTYQMIDVPDYEGKGETAPTAFFYQNLGEAEYAVALFQYMVLIGYPPEKISILTTYNGQKSLLQDVLSQRCGASTPFASIRPGAVSTVDRYQGQQNDYVILSLVRTSAVGHLRDVRRLVVAVSRARLGLYVLCRSQVFASHSLLQPTIQQLLQRPSQLCLVLNEQYASDDNVPSRKCDDVVDKKLLYKIDDVGHLGSMVHSLQQQWVYQASDEG